MDRRNFEAMDVNDRERDSDSNILLYDAEIAPRCTSTSLRVQLKQRDYPVFDRHLHLEFSQASSFAFAFSFRFILPLDRTFRQTDNKLQRKEDNKLQREEVCCGGKAFYLMERIFFKISWYLRRRRCPLVELGAFTVRYWQSRQGIFHAVDPLGSSLVQW